MAIVRITLPPASLFVQTPTYSVNDTVVFGLLQPPTSAGNDDSLITVTQPLANRLDRIAAQNIGDERYWWSIALANNMIDPLTECSTSTVLRVPSRRSLD